MSPQSHASPARHTIARHTAAKLVSALVSISLGASSVLAQGSPSVAIGPGIRAAAASVGAARASLDSSDVRHSAALTFSELLQARLASVSVMMSGGTLAGGGRLLIRGPSTLVTDGAPLLIVDGMPVSNQEDDAYATASRLDDISVDDIAMVDVLRGPAAATLYGAGASSGVIVVTTKHGSAGRMRSYSRLITDARSDAGGYADSFRREGVWPGGSVGGNQCTLRDQADRQCTPTTLQRWNFIDSFHPFGTGLGALASTDLSGGNATQTARLSVVGRRANGISTDDQLSRVGGRLNVSQLLGRRTELTAHVGFNRDEDVGSNAGALIESAYQSFLPPDSATAFNGAADSLLHQPGRDQALRHVTVGAEMTAHPTARLTIRGALSRDRVDEHAVQTIVNSSAAYRTTTENRNTGNQTLNASRGTAELTHQIGVAAGTLVFGAERQVHTGDWQQVTRSGFVDANGNQDTRYIQSTLGDATTTQTSRHAAGWTDRALFASERVAIGDRFAASAGVRREQDASVDQQWRMYPTADLSALLMKSSSASLRAHAAYGETAQPYAIYAPTRAIQLIPDIYYGNAPSVPKLAPVEQTHEREAGLDLQVGTRAGIQATYYTRHSTVVIPTDGGPATGGFFPVATNAAIYDHGIELDARARIVDGAAFRWELRAVGAMQSNRLSGNAGVYSGPAMLQDGVPVWSAIRRYRYSDANGDGIISAEEITFNGESPESHQSTPSVEGALHSMMSFGHGFSVTAVLDHRGGFWSSESSSAWHCRYGRCQWLNDPSTPLELQAAALRYDQIVEDASFTRLRELSLRWTVPTGLARSLGSDDVTLVVAGRDLFTWTDWHGLDPEIASNPRSAVIHDDLNGVPLPRRIMLGVELGY